MKLVFRRVSAAICLRASRTPRRRAHSLICMGGGGT